MSDPINIECRGSVNTAPHSTHEVLLDPFLVCVLSYLALEFLGIQAQLLCIAERSIWIAESCLVFVEKVVHGPELFLNRGRLCCFSGGHSVLVYVCLWEVAKDESQFGAEGLLNLLHFWICCAAIGTLIVAAFDQCQGSIHGSFYMVAFGGYRNRQPGSLVPACCFLGSRLQ